MDENESEFLFDKEERESWSASEKRAFVFQRLQELGVDVQFKEDALTIWVPFGMEDLAFMEIGYLLAQVGDEDYPEHFYKGLSEKHGSKLFPGKDARYYPRQPLEYCDAAPHGMKLKLYRIRELERLKQIGK